MAVESERGYLILAVNRPNCDYVAMATRLAESIKSWHPHAQVCLLTDTPVDIDIFDFVKLLPYGDQTGYANDWQVWWASPFRETIKLEADMLVVSEIDHWWDMFRHREVVISKGSRDFYDRLATSRFYRRVFDDNNLPDVYNAISYWRLGKTADEFWKLVRDIFANWDSVRSTLKFPPETADTDLVYAMACRIIGEENVTLPDDLAPTIVHMKKHMIPVTSSKWQHELVWEPVDRGLRINTINQWGCFHYHDKSWSIDGR